MGCHPGIPKENEGFFKGVFFTLDEGECVQCMHSGSYDREPETIALMYSYTKEQNSIPDLTPKPATPLNISRRSPPLQTGKTENRHQDSGKGRVTLSFTGLIPLSLTFRREGFSLSVRKTRRKGAFHDYKGSNVREAHGAQIYRKGNSGGNSRTA